VNFFRHVLKVALLVGLMVGLFIFGSLLYVSDFGAKTTSYGGAAVPAVAAADAPVTPAGQPIEQRALQWVFGAPDSPSGGATP
jgi:hypothetical protein